MEFLNTKELYKSLSILKHQEQEQKQNFNSSCNVVSENHNIEYNNIINNSDINENKNEENGNKDEDEEKNNVNEGKIYSTKENYDCDVCEGENTLIYDEGMIVCKNCGEVCSRYLDLSHEWNNYDNQGGVVSSLVRCGHPVDPRNENLRIGTSIGKSYKSYNLRRTHIYITGNYACQATLAIDTLIESKGSKLNIPKAIINDIKILYFEINNIQISRGNNREAFLASCFYLTCQKRNWLINVSNLLDIFNITMCDLTNANKKIPNILHSKKIKLLDNMHLLSPNDYVTSFLFKLNINKEFTNLIQTIITKVCELQEINKNTPQAITCGVIYFVTTIFKLNISLENIVEISDISYNTIKNCYKKIYNYKHNLISKKLQQKLNITL